ncbi:aflYb/ hxtA/ putative hexose transporter [Polychaeton citri CBS 116435]|uniref:AflYb/ hxtA/ putative hexose transporter n=1 Tax=Polychaeton citri CBS 116435 TaxID=1314669 RepID=A0A9P4QEP7_9PEZI|nr:aflYb/ hxtA/ putative hexose transporter [Polychaeton citri CBS 116435]
MVAGPAVGSKGDEAFKALPNNTHPKWWRDPGLRRLNIGILLIFASATANGFDAALMNGLLAIPQWHEDMGEHLNTNVLGLIIAGISLGGLPALIPAGYVSDHWGRKVCLAIGTSIMIVTSIVMALTKGPWAFLAMRLIMGVGIAFILIPAPALSSEIAHPRNRGTVTACFQTAFYWGAILSAAATFGGLYIPHSWSWRFPTIMQLFFPSLQVIGLFIAPESPRFLIAKGKRDKALEILAKFHANGDKDDALVQYEFQEMCEAIAREANATSGTGFKAFFQTKGNRHRLLICFLVGIMIQWAGNGIVSYYLAPILASVGITDPSQQAAINLGLQVWNAIMALGGAVAAERYGRRPLWLISCSGMLVCFTIITALSAVYAELGNIGSGKAVVAMLFLFFGFYDIAFTPLSFAYPVEILPYKLRARGLSVTLSTVFAAGFFNQYVNPIALEKLAWRFYFVYIACLVVFLFIIWFLFPETKGRSLEEIAVVFDGPEAGTEARRRASVVVAASRAGSIVSFSDPKEAVVHRTEHFEKL